MSNLFITEQNIPKTIVIMSPLATMYVSNTFPNILIDCRTMHLRLTLLGVYDLHMRGFGSCIDLADRWLDEPSQCNMSLHGPPICQRVHMFNRQFGTMYSQLDMDISLFRLAYVTTAVSLDGSR